MKTVEWKSAAAFGAGVLYLLGLIAFQVHLLRFGILDLSLLQTRYLVVGIWVLLTVSPAAVLVALGELRLANRIERTTCFLLGVIAAAIGVSLLVLYSRFPDVAQVFDFRFYGYPRWYVISNITSTNIQLCMVWICLCIARRLGASRNTISWVGSVLLALIIITHVVFFGRTVFPALSRGVGGGAPQLARVQVGGVSIDCILIHESATALYVMRLQRPVLEARLSRPLDQLAADKASPIRRALEQNEVMLIPSGKVDQVTLYGFDQTATLTRYLDDHRHMVP
jgi:hypothetical protein